MSTKNKTSRASAARSSAIRPQRATAPRNLLARKHIARLRREMRACGCPKPVIGVGPCYCPPCVDRYQIVRLLGMVP